MSSLALFWVFVTVFGLVIVFIVFVISNYYRRRLESIIKDTLSVTDLEGQKQRLDEEIKQCMKSRNENRKELRKLKKERQQQESLRQELSNLSDQVAQEEQKRDEYKKEVTDLQNSVSAILQERDRLESEMEDLETKIDVAKEQFDDSDEAKSLIKARLVKRHGFSM